MSSTEDKDQKTEAPTDKRRREAERKGNVLQSRDLATALVLLLGAGWLALAGGWAVDALATMLREGLRFDGGDLRSFDPAARAGALIAAILLPLASILALTLVAAIAAPALLGSLGFRSAAMGFKAERLDPLAGAKRLFGMQGLIELAKSLVKVAVLGAVGWLVLDAHRHEIASLGHYDPAGAAGVVGAIFVQLVLAMAGGLAAIALIDVPMQAMQRNRQLRMSKQEIKEEHKQDEGSPELKGAVRRRQYEMARGSSRQALAEATVVLVNPTHFAVALRYRPGVDAAPIVVARGRGAVAEAIRDLAAEGQVPVLRYPELTRALYFTARAGDVVREELFVAVATILAFIFNLDAALAAGRDPPDIDVPDHIRFDEDGRPAA